MRHTNPHNKSTNIEAYGNYFEYKQEIEKPNAVYCSVALLANATDFRKSSRKVDMTNRFTAGLRLTGRRSMILGDTRGVTEKFTQTKWCQMYTL